MGNIQPDSSVIQLGMQKLYYYYGISNSDARLDLVAPVNGVHPQNSNYVSPASHSVMGLIWQSPGSERRAIYEYYTKSTQNYGYWTIAPENGHLPNNPSIGFVRIIGYVGESADYEEEVPTTPAQLDHEDSPFGWLPAVTIADEIDDAKDIGLKWTRESTSYSFITDYNKGPYNFKEYNEPRKKRLINYDHTLTEIASAGINILGLFWVEEAVEERSWIPTDEMEYRNFIKAVVERYDGDDDLGCIALAPDCYVVGDNMYPSQETINALKSNPIKYWEVENEPNYNIRLHNGFAELQKITYEAIKQANPEAQVLIGGVAGWTSDYSGVSFQKHFKPILTELNGQHMDIFNIHWYGCANGDYKMIDHGNEEEVLTIVKDALEENGFSRGMSIWITETGSSTGVALGSKDEVLCEYTSETKQAGDYVKRYVYATKEGIDKLFGVLNLGESFWITYEHYFSQTSLIYDGKGTYDLGAGIKKLSYYSIKLMIDKLTGSDWDNVQEVYAQDNVYAYKLIKDGQPIYVAWWDSWEEPDAKSKSINLEVDFNGDVIITKAVPTGEGVSEINGEDLDENNYPNFFNTETKTVNNGIINLQLRGIPVYVEPISS